MNCQKVCLSGLGMALLLQGCVTSGGDDLSILARKPLTYQCDEQHQVIVKYYALSDESLFFAKIELPDSPEITLAGEASASGMRYSNGAVAWQGKGRQASMQVRNQYNQWQFHYRECEVVTDGRE